MWVAYVAVLILQAGCAATPLRCAHVQPGQDSVTVLSRGWHTEIALDAAALTGPLARFRQVFPGARTLLFGYGKRTFFTARADRPSEYLLGPFPGPAVIEVIGLSTTAQAAYGEGDSVTLPLPADGEAALAAFIWADLVKDSKGAPLLVAPGLFPGSLFYSASSEYTLAHTCNTWVAAALHQGGLPISEFGVVFSGQVIARAAAAAQCRGGD